MTPNAPAGAAPTPPQMQAPAPAPPPPTQAAPPVGPQVKKAYAKQLKLSVNELMRLAQRIEQDYFHSIADHQNRMRKFQQFYLRWRNRTELPALGEEEMSNFRVPLTQWQVYTKWAKEVASLFGDDAEVVAKPIGPDDQRRVKKVGRFMSWRLFDSMRLINSACMFSFRKILFGRSVAYAPWKRDTYFVPMDDGTEQETVHYEGPGFEPLWPDDFMVPAEDVQSLQDFSFCIRRYRATPNDLLVGEDAEQYSGIKKNFEQILNFSNDRRQRDFQGEQVKREKDLAEGVLYEGGLSAAGTLIVHEWYGRWRMLKGKSDGRENNLDRRELYESDLVVRYLPDLHLIIGVQNLADMYPSTKNRRPFVEAALVKDGSYWSPSYGELLDTIETELSSNHNLANEALQFGVLPMIFYKPSSGFDAETFRYRPGTSQASDDPSGVRVIELAPNLEPTVMRGQDLISFGERITGLTDQNMGRVQDRPNAPRTARQTMALLEEGDVRGSLDVTVFREDWGTCITHFWALERMYGSPQTFFRVTEEDAGGLFPVAQGGSMLTDADRTGEYDFDLKLATNVWSREQNKQNQLALYQIDLQNPLVVNNPRALWMVLDKIHKAMGDDRFADVIPEPADIGLPVQPKEEWTRALEGEQIFVNPMDNDQLHISDHNRRLGDAAQDPNHDPRAYNEMVLHVRDHIRQMQQKALMAEMVSRIAGNLRDGSGGLVGGGPPASLQQVHQQLGAIVDPEGTEAAKPKPKKKAA